MTLRTGSPGFQTGITSAFAPSSTYATFALMPGTGRSYRIDFIISPSTGAEPMDVRLVASPVSETSQFNFPSTTFENKSCSFVATGTKNAHTFALQARQSTNSTSYSTQLQAYWISLG